MDRENNIFKQWTLQYWLRLWKVWRYDPEYLRRAVRDSGAYQIVLCAVFSLLVSIVTLYLHRTVLLLHKMAFALPPGAYLSAGEQEDRLRTFIVPVIGGLVLGLYYLSKILWKQRDIIDPIEANAVYGGRMSIRDSVRLTLVTLISNCAGGSIGMEAAYTQVGSSIFSWFGQRLRLRREDMRIFVAAGSAAAIAAAFNAPLAGAFYAFELVLGSYLPTALPQVSIAALTGALFIRATAHTTPIFSLSSDSIAIGNWQFPLFVLLGIIAAAVGITTMKLVTRFEQWFRHPYIPSWARPLIGGIALSVLALLFPQVLGGGQGAVNYHLHNTSALSFLIALLAVKVAASAISIGAGFRGGLFSSSLLIGCLIGQIFGTVVGYFAPAEGQLASFMLVGIGATGASIIGAPVTMILLVLEMTGDFSVTTGVLAGVLVASAITRYRFGYSFSTWRFHLRGLRILGAHDIGWVKDITVAGIMRTGMKTTTVNTKLSELRETYPAGSAKRIFVVDENGLYKGVLDVAMLYDAALISDAEAVAADVARHADRVLLPSQDIKAALKTFSKAETEELPVVQSAGYPQLIGYVTEAYALRRYNQELEKRTLMSQEVAPVHSPTDSVL